METGVVSQKETQMRGMFFRGAVGALMVLAVTRVASAQVLVQLPDSSQTTTLTATVSDQATVTTPANVTFTVNDVASSTAGSAAAVTVTGIVLPTAADKLKVSVKANAASFTPPVALATTWDASDVSWTGGTWTNATAASGTLSSASFGEVARCDADVSACNSTDVAFTLAAKSTVKRSGNHTLTITWKFEKL
jgi:ABC-type transport system substrate-binding protein